VAERAPGDPGLRNALDAILAQLDAVTQAQVGLSEADRDWFATTLRKELDGLGNLARFEAALVGSGAIAQGAGAQAVGQRGIGTRNFQGLAVTGDQNIVVLAAEAAEAFWRQFGSRRLSETELRRATESYLAHLMDRYRYLDFRGMGVSDRAPLRLPLVEMYIPLKARVELPQGETWSRELRLAGRRLSAEEDEVVGRRLGEPAPVLDLLRQYDGLVLLGDPGAGKTTFLKYLALRLALGEGEALGLGARLPVLLPLSAYANALAARDVPLNHFIAAYYRDRGVDLPIGPMLDEALDQGGALLLLDGLDEVKDLAQRHLVVQRVLEFFTFQRRRGNKFVLSSRVVGYRDVRPTVEGLAEGTLVDFEDDEIAQFVKKWTGALERAARGDTPVARQEADRERRELLDAVQHNPGVRRLAANPLLLTILALMKRQGVTLPERRVELYQKYVETLLKHWNLARGLDRPPSRDLDVVETVRVLAPLALWMHETSPGVGLVKREAARRKLEEICAGRGAPEPERAARRLLEDVREHAGLLLERGPGEYGFIHLTFQEYLAAVAIAQRGQRDVGPVVETLAAHVGDDNWHEVTLLTAGYMGIVQQRDEAAGAVLLDLIRAAPGEPGQAVVLAGRAVADAWPGGVTAACRERVVEALVQTMTDDERVAAPRRAAAGRSLAVLGDPRDFAALVAVPAGPFLMGSSEADDMAYDDEKPQHEVTLPAFKIGKYPVTNAQYLRFVEATGREWWDEGRQPERANQPAVRVNWHDARAYCAWVTKVWRAEGVIAPDEAVRLPTEAEWEKAARGGLSLDGDDQGGARRYPWGDDLDPNRANYDETGIGTASAVGCFPNGISP
ncbi:MAG: SUMF1/EgtB/PvdO family nonheme iron enzyme, partial [Delftia sp.]|nr:SUMF1/EgtB/PvdO family nonheme iron enzyme [Delftia sp.]